MTRLIVSALSVLAITAGLLASAAPAWATCNDAYFECVEKEFLSGIDFNTALRWCAGGYYKCLARLA